MTIKEFKEYFRDSPDDTEVKFVSPSGIEWFIADTKYAQESGKPDLLKFKLK